MALPPIKLRLGGEDVHLVASRELDRWGGYLNGKRGAYELITPENIADIRSALMCPRWVDTEGVYTELYKQLEDRSAVFFEIPPEDVPFDAPPIVDIHELLPTGGDPSTHQPQGPGPDPGVHWIEIVCISSQGGSYAGAKARLRLPDGRSEYVTLDGGSSVRFDDLTEGGTVHFELSGDAIARGNATVPVATRYELGKPIGLVTRKRHVLVVHPNPNAFVSVALFVGDEPVLTGRYTLATNGGDDQGTLDAEAARADGFSLPSPATYAFEEVILPPRPVVQPEEDRGTDGVDASTDGGSDGRQPGGGPDPGTTPPLGPLPADSVRISLRLDDGTPLPATIELQHARTETVEGDQATFDGVDGQPTLVIRGARIDPAASS
ncbi:MAG: hypothetical protein NXI35_14105 [bacterium]|nr:hypothetical protein [bacterium]